MRIAGQLPPIKEEKFAVSMKVQFRALLYRKLVLTHRDRRQVMTQFFAAIFQGVFLGLAFWQVVDQEAQNVLSFFFILLQVGAMSGMSAMPALISSLLRTVR